MTPRLVRSVARMRRALVLTGTLATAGPVVLHAQGPTGTIEGQVRDTAGAAVALAQLHLVGTPYATMADSLGRFRFPALRPAVYRLHVRQVGYGATDVDSVIVQPGRTTVVDVALVPAAVEIQEITVVAAANALVPRDQVTSKHLIDGTYTDRLPRERTMPVVALQPGVVASPGTTQLPERGGRTDGNNAYIDGVPITGASGSSVAAPPAGESYARIHDNPFLDVIGNPLSTFGIDVDRASYSNIRRFLAQGRLPPADAVRIEELINYFEYEYPEPAARGPHPFTVTTEVAVAPWAPSHQLVRVGLQSRHLDATQLPPANLVFLIDVSGSMAAANKLPLVKASLRMLVEQLRAEDHVALVVYAGAAGLVLQPTAGDRREIILEAIDRLGAGGSTAGGAGLRLAYATAREGLITGGNNRVILATDGDFNVGVASDAEMERLVEAEREHGIFLTVLGFGMGNLQDAKLETLADHGNGNYAYIDGLAEARKTLVHELAGTLFTVAKDVKLQLEFNPARVASYRLIGYENRMLAAEDFADDAKDAGDLGAGHAVTALYEVVPVGATPVARRPTDSLRYQRVSMVTRAGQGDELLFVKLRYKAPDGRTSRELTHAVPARVRRASDDLRFISAVAAFGMILRDSEHRGEVTLADVLDVARRSVGEDRHGYRAGFVAMVEEAIRLTAVAD
ncbi:MAG: von Willebrand factor type A domain-containing protein [Gemmatimonadetes bacterium]|nr:von Willebrand factor type A domain-containing protein [Gemmatimonadota bacterium]